jgi:hypothetical protein
MDHMMPHMDGVQTTTHLRELGYREPIVALTANAISGQKDYFLSNGFDGFLSKPIDIHMLNSVLNKYIRDKQTPEVIDAARLMKDADEDNAAFGLYDALLLESFARDARKAVACLEEIINSPSFDEEGTRKYTIMFHGIKSCLYNIGETELSETAAKLELAGRDGDTGYIKTAAPGFYDKLRSILENHETVTDDYVNLNGDGIDKLRECLREVSEMCADYNRKGALEMLAGIAYDSKETKDVVEELKKLIIHGDFDKAENAALEYLSKI